VKTNKGGDGKDKGKERKGRREKREREVKGGKVKSMMRGVCLYSTSVCVSFVLLSYKR